VVDESLYVTYLPKAEPRLRRRYDQLVVALMNELDRIACGLHPPPGEASQFAAVQAAWRFYNNPSISLPQLAQPLISYARYAAVLACDGWLLNALDWSLLHYNDHRSKADRVSLGRKNDLGYTLLTALTLSDRDGRPLAPVCLDLQAAKGVHSTRAVAPLPAGSRLDDLTDMMEYVEGLKLGRPVVHIIDREADSVGHYRYWDLNNWHFVVRADDNRQVLHNGQARRLDDIAQQMRRDKQFKRLDEVEHKGQLAWQWVAETTVVLHRPARQHRVVRGKARHVQVPGPPLALRLVVSEIRSDEGRLLARWLLLSNVPLLVTTAMIALWYYWRWRIESYHKLLKSGGYQVEHWQQETAEALARRLAVTAMAAVVVWRLARDQRPEAAELRDVLVRLSGRQMKRGRQARGFTEPALLAGLGVFVAALALTEQYTVPTLRGLALRALPEIFPGIAVRRESG
jgi:hypothetical protein